MQVTPLQAVSVLSKLLRANLVPMLTSSPGEGKSSLAKEVAAFFQLKLIDVRLAQSDPTDLLGFPCIDEKRGKAGYLPMETFPIEGDPLPDGYLGWLILFDEANSATDTVISAAYKVVLDKMIGQKKLHAKVAMMMAGNLETDNAIVNPMGTAMQSRLVHLELAQDYLGWVNWAIDNGFDHRITDFIKFKPAALYSFKPDHSDKTFGCPRTFEFTNRILGVTNIDDPDCLPMLAGALSEGLAMEFYTFCKIYKELPTMEAIIKTPMSIKVPSEPSVLFALTGAIASAAQKDNVGSLMEFVSRIPVEFQVVTVRDLLHRNKTLSENERVRSWISINAEELF